MIIIIYTGYVHMQVPVGIMMKMIIIIYCTCKYL